MIHPTLQRTCTCVHYINVFLLRRLTASSHENAVMNKVTRLKGVNQYESLQRNQMYSHRPNTELCLKSVCT